MSNLTEKNKTLDKWLPKLEEKWREVPGGSDSSKSIFSTDLLDYSDNMLLKYWDEQYTLSHDTRRWYFNLYGEFLRSKKVLEIGSGLGYDAIHFSSLGANWTCCDIAKDNLQIISRLAKLKNTKLDTVYVDSIKAFEKLPHDFDVIWCNGSLINLPFDAAKEECSAILPHLRGGGRWIELVYPRERWVRTGMMPFEQWGKITDGDRTPWMEWYDSEKLKSRLYPTRFEVVMDYSWRSNYYTWIDMVQIGVGEEELPQPFDIQPPEGIVSTSADRLHRVLSISLKDLFCSNDITVDVICSVKKGSIGFALVHDEKRVSNEIVVDSLEGSQLIHLSAYKCPSGTSLNLRNMSGYGASQFHIESIKVRPSF